MSPPDTDTASLKVAAPIAVTVDPSCAAPTTVSVPPTKTLFTDMLPSIDVLIPVRFEPSP